MKIARSLHAGLVRDLHAEGVREIPGFGLCIFMHGSDLVKLLRINIRKNLGADVLYGDLAILSESDFSEIDAKPTLKDGKQPPSLTVCPIMNFPDLMKVAYLQNGMPTKNWIQMVGALFAALPDCMEEVNSMFERDFAKLQPIERIPTFVRHLRSSLELDGL